MLNCPKGYIIHKSCVWLFSCEIVIANFKNSQSLLQFLVVLSCLAATCLAAPRNELTCSLCTDIITDIDNFITSDKTEEQIVEFVSQVGIKDWIVVRFL